MKKIALGLVAMGALCGFNAAYADDPCQLQGTAVPVSQIQTSINGMAGLSLVKAIKLSDHCVYQAKVKDASGQKWKLFFDPITGSLIGKSQD